MVPLDLFPTGLLESVSTSKTFTPDQPGDFSGASVNLRTRDFPGQSHPVAVPRHGLQWRRDRGHAADGAARRDGVGRVPGSGARTAGRSGGRGRSFGSDPGRDERGPPVVPQRLDTRSGRRHTEGRLRVTLGGGGTSLGYIASLTYRFDQELREREERAQAIADGEGGTLAQNVSPARPVAARCCGAAS